MTQVKPAPEDAVLGKYAFADERTDVPSEPNTKREKELWKALAYHFHRGASVSSDLVDEILQILHEGLYTDYFRPYKKGVLYRGMSVPEDYLKKALGIKDSSEIPQKGKKQVSLVFKPYNGIAMSSWSSDITVSKRWALTNVSDECNYMVVMSAKADNNDFCWIALGEKDFKEENELPALGHVKVFEIQWKRMSDNAWQNFSID